ncbi:hypothetical protein DF182_14040 [Chitinophaga flava]|uniref:Uncharacterized protein n=1 Tax=Chitinophaga flava TaxID=2259036 RepID=A0A365Y4W4_9BACT|nr:hypothetical protein DF182_14040 [Chitinophaga flava]
MFFESFRGVINQTVIGLRFYLRTSDYQDNHNALQFCVNNFYTKFLLKINQLQRCAVKKALKCMVIKNAECTFALPTTGDCLQDVTFIVYNNEHIKL